MSGEFQVGAHTYRGERIDPFKQQNLVRRLAPIATALVGAIDDVRNAPTIAALAPLVEAFARMPDGDMEYVMATALGSVKRQQGNAWSRVYVPGGGLAFDDIDLLEMNEIIFNVLRESLGPFFAGLARRGLIVMPAAPAAGPATTR